MGGEPYTFPPADDPKLPPKQDQPTLTYCTATVTLQPCINTFVLQMKFKDISMLIIALQKLKHVPFRFVKTNQFKFLFKAPFRFSRLLYIWYKHVNCTMLTVQIVI